MATAADEDARCVYVGRLLRKATKCIGPIAQTTRLYETLGLFNEYRVRATMVETSVGEPPTDESSLLKNDQRAAETHARDGEVHGADDRHDEQFRPDNIDAGCPVEDGLSEADEMRRAKDLHETL